MPARKGARKRTAATRRRRRTAHHTPPYLVDYQPTPPGMSYEDFYVGTNRVDARLYPYGPASIYAPSESAQSFPIGTEVISMNDGNRWIVGGLPVNNGHATQRLWVLKGINSLKRDPRGYLHYTTNVI